MPQGVFLVKDITPEEFGNRLENLIKSLGWRIKQQKYEVKEVKIKALTRGKLETILWRILIPFGGWMERGQRCGIEAHLKIHPEGTIFGVAVVPYMEVFDKEEIFFISQGLTERIIDNEYSNKCWNALMGQIQAKHKLWSYQPEE